jgi:hypothetical protein
LKVVDLSWGISLLIIKKTAKTTTEIKEENRRS